MCACGRNVLLSFCSSRDCQTFADNHFAQETAPELAEVPMAYVKTDKIANPVPDPVKRPAHYTQGKFEVWDVLDDWFPTNPLRWQVGKYIARADHKGHQVEDLKKAKAYLEREIAKLEAEKA